MSFHNRVRLPIYIARPQLSADKVTYTKANGDTETLSATLKKIYEGRTAWMPEPWHDKLMVALQHDSVLIEGEKYYGGIVSDGTYNIDWDAIFNTPMAGAKFAVIVTPFDNSNDNCMTCDQASQVHLVDDLYPDTIEEDEDYALNVIGNDDVCCYPVVFSITSYNTDYLDSAAIDSLGNVTFHTKTPLTAANGIILLTYRATCSNGGYDEADVTGNINGSIEACLAPTDLNIINLLTTSFRATWNAPSPVPDHYFWQLTDPSFAVIQSGYTNALFVDVTGALPLTSYRFRVRSQCTGPITNNTDDNASNWIQVAFTTNPVAPGNCGSFRVFPTAGPATGTITYLGCDGLYHTVSASLFTPLTICALQSSPGVYTDIHSSVFTGLTITYLSICGGTPTATLTFNFSNAGGSFLNFGAGLNTAIDAAVNITKVFADGFALPGCSGGAVSSAQKNSLMSIAPGAFATGAPPTTTSGVWASASHYSIYNVIVNGVPVVNGSTQMIGSYLVTMVIPSCV